MSSLQGDFTIYCYVILWNFSSYFNSICAFICTSYLQTIFPTLFPAFILSAFTAGRSKYNQLFLLSGGFTTVLPQQYRQDWKTGMYIYTKISLSRKDSEVLLKHVAKSFSHSRKDSEVFVQAWCKVMSGESLESLESHVNHCKKFFINRGLGAKLLQIPYFI